jgi:glutathione-regulated potassium-efflux system ancillary protein KefC/glutathione-regulated potassium-efflux system protein KefB
LLVDVLVAPGVKRARAGIVPHFRHRPPAPLPKVRPLMLTQIAIYLLAAIIAVPLSRKLGLGAVLGYLGAGMVIGPWGLKLVEDVETMLHVSEFGVILLLFIIGLELQPSRLWVLRRQVFGLGSAQVGSAALVLGGIAWGLGLPWQAALVAGMGLAMSSTAFVLQTLAERKELTTRQGRESFAILLFQDLSVIPLLAALPFLAASLGQGGGGHGGSWMDALKAVAIIAALVVSSRFLIRPLFRAVATLGGREIFTATALFIVVGVTLLMEVAGLTASLGAFLAGMLLADSEYRHELEADIEPFKGLLMGLFFIAVGMSANLGLLAQKPLLVAAIVFAMVAIKFALLLAIGRIAGNRAASARKLGLALAQGGEFAFVLFGTASSSGLFPAATADLLVVAVTVSMLLAPLLFVLDDRVLTPWLDRTEDRPFDSIEPQTGHVVVAGYGRVGQIVTRVLSLKNIPFVALEKDADQVDTVRRFGGKLYFGDATRLELLTAANTGSARLFVLAIDDPADSIKCAELVRHHFPALPVVARARNRLHAHRLADLGITRFYRETWHTSLEMAQQALLQLRIPPSEAAMAVARFRDHDLALLKRQRAVYQDESKLIQTSREASTELLSLYEADREEDDEASPPAKAEPA